MKTIKSVAVAMMVFGLTQQVSAKSVCYWVCNKITCKVKEIQEFCQKHCKNKDTKHCLQQHAKQAKEIKGSALKQACDKGFNRVSCKDKRVAKIAAKICQKDQIKNCLKAAGM